MAGALPDTVSSFPHSAPDKRHAYRSLLPTPFSLTLSEYKAALRQDRPEAPLTTVPISAETAEHTV